MVVSLEQAVAAPYCACRLADAGARVIKIERPEGDFARRYDTLVKGESAYFVWLNRGKESVTLDIKAPDDKALLTALLGKADVFIQNLAPGAAERAGFGSAAWREARPELITVDISGYGEDGPYRDMKAYDLLVQAESGLCSVTGTPDQPGRVGVSVCDVATGMYAYTAVLEALIARGISGRGMGIKTSLFAAMADWMSVPLLQHKYGGKTPKRVGLAHPTIAPYGAFPCADGKPILISIQNEREWKRLCSDVLEAPEAAEDPRFIDNSARVASRDALDSLCAERFAERESDAMATRLKAAGIAFGRLNDMAGLADHPQLRMLAQEIPGNTQINAVAPPAEFIGAPRAMRPVPPLGAHTAAVRREFLGG